MKENNIVTIQQLARETNKSTDELLLLIQDRIPEGERFGSGYATFFNEEGAKLVRLAAEIPAAVPPRLKARVIGPCANDKWVWCRIEGMEGRHPVLIPRRLRGKILGKPITIEAITDINGTTYRHESIGR